MKRIVAIILSLMTVLCACSKADSEPQDLSLVNEKPATQVYIDLTERKTNAPAGTVAFSEDCVTVSGEGSYRVFGTLDDGTLVVDAAKDEKVELLFDGVTLEREDYAPLYIKKADSVTVKLLSGTTNKLSNGGAFASLDDNNVDAALFSKTDLIVAGDGKLSIVSPGGHGITCKDALRIDGGELEINCSRHALEANDRIEVNGGNLLLVAGEDGIHTENDEDSNLGIFTMNDGYIEIDAADDAVHAVASLNIISGDMKIKKCFEGLEAAKIFISGGSVYIDAEDDGINATVGTDLDCYNGEAVVTISGGRTTVVTRGDALDSNGDLLLSGGEVICHGPGNTVHGYGTLDFVNKAVVTGGRLIAFTSRGKAFSEESEQAAFNLNLDSMTARGTVVTVLDDNGDVLFSETAEAAFNCVIVSVPELAVGNCYTVKIGERTIEVNQRNLITKAKER